ncbi:MAG: fibronectin type III domain-containing protein [Thermoplasmata archaeon]|nr:MAG: fibronectin type III domain-containing protein [Thermoplasmata archaeon]
MSIHRASVRTLILVALVALLMVSLGMLPAAGDSHFKLRTEREEDGNVRLIWTANEDEAHDHYRIYWEEEEFDSVEDLKAQAAERGTTFVPQNLENDVYYYFAVTSVDENSTILAIDFAERAQREPELKVVNFRNLMIGFFIVTGIYIYVLMKIPTWAKKAKGGA